MPTAALHEILLALKVPGGLLKPQTVESHTRISNSVHFRWKQKNLHFQWLLGGLVTGAKTTALEPLGQQMNTLAHLWGPQVPSRTGQSALPQGSLPGVQYLHAPPQTTPLCSWILRLVRIQFLFGLTRNHFRGLSDSQVRRLSPGGLVPRQSASYGHQSAEQSLSEPGLL